MFDFSEEFDAASLFAAQIVPAARPAVDADAAQIVPAARPIVHCDDPHVVVVPQRNRKHLSQLSSIKGKCEHGRQLFLKVVKYFSEPFI